MQKYPISLVIITLNEEKNIERCIRSVPFAAEVVVLDSGSQDRTVDIARKLGARVFVETWRGFAKQKIRATALALNDWVLSLDADEALSPELAQELTEILNSTISVPVSAPVNSQMLKEAYAMPRMTYYFKRWMRHSGMYPDYQTRLFNRKQVSWLDANVHERIVAKNVEYLKHPILHWSFADLSHQISTVNKYSSLRALDFKSANKKFSFFKMIFKMKTKFIETYLFKQGFRDGMPGLIASIVSAYATFLRWAKLYEIEINENKGTQSSQRESRH